MAANGQEALDYLRRHEPPCLILLDLAMPVMDGQAFLAEQRKEARLAAIPVVALTGLDDPVTTRELEPLVAATLVKPITLPEVRKMVERFCG